MASIPVVLHRIRRARRETGRSQSVGQYQEYRPAYREILGAAQDAGGEDVLDDIMEWAVEWTKQERQLPDPETMRQQAREILEARDIELPAGSPLEHESEQE